MIESVFRTFITKFSVSGINFLLLILTGRLLGAEERGDIVLALLAVSIVSMINDVISGPAVTYLAPRFQNLPIVIASYLWALVCSFTGISLLDFLGKLPEGSFLWVFLITLFLCLHSVHQSLLIGLQQYNKYNLLQITNTVILLAGFILSYFLFNNHQAEGYLKAFCMATVVQFVTGVFFIRKTYLQPFKLPDRGLLILLIKNGLFTQWASLTYLLSSRYLFYVLNQNSGTAELGVFSTGLTLAEACLLFSGSIAVVISGKVSNSQNTFESAQICLSMMRLSALITSIACLILILLPQSFYTMLLGSEFAQVKNYFIPVLPGIIAQSYFAVISHFFSGIARFYLNALMGTGCLLITMLLSYNFAYNLFPIQAAIIISITSLVSALGYWYLFYKTHKYKFSELFPGKAELLLISNLFVRR